MKYNKILIFLLVFFILFTFNLSCFAASYSQIDYTNYDYLYTYTTYKDDTIVSLEETALSDDRVISGDYYYFAVYNYGDRTYNLYLIEKSSISDNLPLYFCNWSENYTGEWTEHFGLGLPSEFDKYSDFVLLSGKNGVLSGTAESSDYALLLTGIFDEDNKEYKFPFATNYTGSISRVMADGSYYSFLNSASSPYIANTAEDLATANFDSLLIMSRWL